MRQLTKVGKGRVEWREVAEPELNGPGEALVRPLAVALCDLDHLIVQGEAPIPGEIALGHEQVGEIVAVGDEVADHRVGERVVVPFQISCGACEFCRRGRTGDCAAVAPQSMYGFGMVGGDWGGALSDLVRVPFADAMLVPLPGGIEPVSLASAGDNVVDGWRTVSGPLSRRPGAPVLVWVASRARWASTPWTRHSRSGPSRSPISTTIPHDSRSLPISAPRSSSGPPRSRSGRFR